jgi:hypothetical protein
MDPATAEALEGSIRKWEAIVRGEAGDQGVTNCPLCAMYNSAYDCEGCPVMEAAGSPGCEYTPYDDWSHAAHKEHGPRNMCRDNQHLATTPELVRLAQAELNFLKSLREEASHGDV